eukprot:scaffold6989_cov90-Phaeocystis_antarctica.AAC.1
MSVSFMCGVWDGWVVSNPNCPARVRTACLRFEPARTVVPVRCVVPTGARGGDRWCDRDCFQLSLQRA